jgi:hypothetical protein
MVMTHYQKFLNNIKLNSYEQLIYQGTLSLHLIFLYQVMDKATYGLQGITFAIIYLTSALLNLGLDTSIAPFFSIATKNKTLFKKLFLYQLAFQAVVLIVAPVFLFVLAGNNSWLGEKMKMLGFGNLLLCWLIVVSEGIKYSLRIFLRCAFLNIKIIFIELQMIFTFVFIVWGLYFETGHITLTTLLAPLAICSGMAVFNLGKVLHTFYTGLPDGDEHQVSPSLRKRIFSSRLFGSLHQINHQLFSGNLLIPSYAYLAGDSAAGTLSLLTSVMYFFKAVVGKTLGSSYEATMSQSKDLDHGNKQELFNKTAGITYSALNILAAALFIVVFPIIMYATRTPATTPNLAHMYLYLIFMFSENFFTIYEKFFIAEEKTHLFLALNIVMNFSFFLITLYPSSTSLTHCLVLIMLIRFLCLGFLIAFSFYRWGIQPGSKRSFTNLFYPLIAGLSFIYTLI